ELRSGHASQLSPSPAHFRAGEGARRADEGRGAKRSGRAGCTTVALTRAGPHPALRATFSHAARGRRGKLDVHYPAWAEASRKPVMRVVRVVSPAISVSALRSSACAVSIR